MRTSSISRYWAWAVAAISVGVLAGCGGGSSTGATGPTTPITPLEAVRVLTSIVVSIPSATIEAGQSATAVAAGFDQQGAVMPIGVPAWTSSQPGVASVGATGLVTAMAPGQATLIARIGEVQGQLPLVVTSRPPGPAIVASVSVSPQVARIVAGQTLQLTAAPKDLSGQSLQNRALSWATSDSAVATVSATGLVTALAEGTAIIEATCETQRGAMALVVTAAVDSEIAIAIALPTGQLPVGDTLNVVATVRSPWPIAGVSASVGGQEMMLAYGPIGNGNGFGWVGRMDLSSLRFGAYVVVVTATDSRGQRNVGSVSIVRDPRVAGGGGKVPTPNKQRLPAVPATIP